MGAQAISLQGPLSHLAGTEPQGLAVVRPDAGGGPEGLAPERASAGHLAGLYSSSPGRKRPRLSGSEVTVLKGQIPARSDQQSPKQGFSESSKSRDPGPKVEAAPSPCSQARRWSWGRAGSQRRPGQRQDLQLATPEALGRSRHHIHQDPLGCSPSTVPTAQLEEVAWALTSGESRHSGPLADPPNPTCSPPLRPRRDTAPLAALCNGPSASVCLPRPQHSCAGQVYTTLPPGSTQNRGKQTREPA